MGVKRIVAALSSVAVAGVGLSTPSFADEHEDEIAMIDQSVTEKVYFTDSCGDIVGGIAEGKGGDRFTGYAAPVKSGWTLHWETEAEVPQDVTFSLYASGGSESPAVVAETLVKKGEKADFQWKVDASEGSRFEGGSKYEEGELAVVSPEIATGPFLELEAAVGIVGGDYVVNPSGVEMGFEVSGVDTACEASGSDQTNPLPSGSENTSSAVSVGNDNSSSGSNGVSSAENSAANADKSFSDLQSAKLAESGATAGVLAVAASMLLLAGAGLIAIRRFAS